MGNGLYSADQGLGLKKSPVPQNENGLPLEGSEEFPEEDETEEGHVMNARAVYPFTGTSDDEV